jgi:hypothetical protein
MGACPIVGERDGSETPSATAGIDRKLGKHAAPTRSNLDFPSKGLFLTDDLPSEDLRFEHKLQTAMTRRRGAPSQFLSIAHGIGATRSPAALVAGGICVTRKAPVVFFPKGIGVACSSAFVCAFRRRRDLKAAAARVPVVFSGDQWGGQYFA